MAITKSTKRFLSIDDDRTLQLIVKQILTKSFGAQTLEVFQASTGEEGLQVMREIKPDIILCDIHMPGMDGFEVCQRVRELKLRSAVILMSAYDAEQDNAIKASDTGADAYLSKPIKKGELLFVVNFVMRVAHLNDAVFENKGTLTRFFKKVSNCYAIMMWSLVSLTLGLFKRLFGRPSKTIRYVADSSYWLYLIHLPIVIWLQIAFAEISLHWSIKLPIISVLTVFISITLYDVFVRSTFIVWSLRLQSYHYCFCSGY